MDWVTSDLGHAPTWTRRWCWSVPRCTCSTRGCSRRSCWTSSSVEPMIVSAASQTIAAGARRRVLRVLAGQQPLPLPQSLDHSRAGARRLHHHRPPIEGDDRDEAPAAPAPDYSCGRSRSSTDATRSARNLIKSRVRSRSWYCSVPWMRASSSPISSCRSAGDGTSFVVRNDTYCSKSTGRLAASACSPDPFVRRRFFGVPVLEFTILVTQTCDAQADQITPWPRRRIFQSWIVVPTLLADCWLLAGCLLAVPLATSPPRRPPRSTQQ